MLLLTVAEASEQIGVSPRTAWAYIHQGRLRATRIGPRRTRVSQAAIDEFLADCTDPRMTCACRATTEAHMLRFSTA